MSVGGVGLVGLVARGRDHIYIFLCTCIYSCIYICVCVYGID